MRLTNALDLVLGSPTKIRLMRRLMTADGKGSTGRELAAQAKVSTAQAARDLRELADVGIVSRTVTGRSYSWRLNDDHVLRGPLRSLFAQEARLRETLMGEISSELRSIPVASARLFGSFARGEERPDSDVDLYIELRRSSDRERLEQSLARIREKIWSSFGNPVSALVYTQKEARFPRAPELMIAIQRDGIDLVEEAKVSDGTD